MATDPLALGDAGNRANPAAPAIARLLRKEAAIPALALLAVAAIQLHLASTRAINWDEFFHYSLTVKLMRGELTDPLQTAFTQVFAWVTTLPGTGIDHILTIRLFMFGCTLITALAIVGTASRFADRTSGLICALTYLSAAYVVQHGSSFRYDPPAAALLSSALYLLACRPLRWPWLVLAGVLMGASSLLTIKSVLYASAFAGIAWLRWSEEGFSLRAAARLALIPLVALVCFAVLYQLHAQALVGDTSSNAQAVIDRSANKMFVLGVPPYWEATWRAVLLSPLQTLMIAAVPVALFLSQRSWAERAAILGLWLPLTTLLFYHNTAPYFHVFMLAPVAMALAAIVPDITRRYGTHVTGLALLASAGSVLWREPESPLDRQRMLVSAAEQIFPKDTAYFDSSAMLGRLRKANAFMTPWGTELYLSGAYPSLTETAARETVPLVIDNELMFTQALHERGPVAGLLPNDVALLRSSYVPFWGPFWLAGFDLPASIGERVIMVTVPGPYTLSGKVPVIIDGVPRQPGNVFPLARGTHVVAGSTGAIRLLWGRRITAPAMPAPPEPYFTGF